MRHDRAVTEPKVVMRHLLSRIPALLVMLSLMAVLHGNAHAAVSASDEKNVHAVVQAQLEAFAANNAGKAFALAAPELQALFGTPARFMAMVRSSYPVVYAPASVAFLKPETQDGDVIQRVLMTDQGGKQWQAIYSLQRQKDRS
jgi:hypothetical protein